MKKILLFLVVLATSIQSFAFSKSTMLRIREERGRAISVTIDGRKYSKINRTLTIGDLPAGMHQLKIFVYNSNGYGYRNGTLIYQGRILTAPGKIYYCTIFDNSIDIEENCCVDNYNQWNNNDNWEQWDNDNNCWNNNKKWDNHRDHNNRDNNNYYDNWSNKNDNDKWNNNSNYNRDNRHDDNHYDDGNWNSYKGVLSNGRYDLLIDQIRKASFESSKVNVAKQALMNNDITVKQLIGILNELSFESTKLDFAKTNYTKVVDPKNYFMVNDVFTFQSSKDELTEYMNSHTR